MDGNISIDPRAAPPGPREPLDIAVEELAPIDRLTLWAWDRVLVLGSGDGRIAEEIWRRQMKGYVCGVERSAELVDRSQHFHGIDGQIEFRLWEGKILPGTDHSFHRVLIQTPLQEFAHPVALLREILRVLREDGELIFLSSDRGSLV